MMTRRGLALAFALAGLAVVTAQSRRPLQVDDFVKLVNVGDPQISPDGEWVVYTVSSTDLTADKGDTDLWMVKWDGSRRVRLTTSSEGESQPRWSPDGTKISFVSSRPGPAKATGAQIWMLNRDGGEAEQVTAIKGRLSDYEWSPDSKRLALLIQETDEAEKPPAGGAGAAAGAAAEKPKTPKPIVIDRYRFKRDNTGYLTRKPAQLHLFDLATKKLEKLTTESLEESGPSWSPDGKWIAFVSNRNPETARFESNQVCVAEAKAGAAVKVLTNTPRSVSGGRFGGRLAWSPDSRRIAYLEGREPQFSAYNIPKVAVVAVEGGEGSSKIVTASLDRGAGAPRWISNSEIAFLVTDDRVVYPAKASADGGAVARLLDGKQVVSSMAMAQANGRVAVLASTNETPGEIHALENGKLRRLTQHNDEFLAGIRLGETREVSFRNKDGDTVNGLLTLPVGYAAGKKVPMLLRIHGGPNGQDAHAFQYERQLFAARGYAVLQVNYRGSSGRGEKFQTAIFADWGNKEVQDLLAGVDHVVASGVADPEKLGIGGWSYGGILTNYTIATDPRFKAATSGASSSLQISMYGADQYTTQYDLEVGYPWKAKERWLKISYPFFEVEKIKTPTLFLCGEKDFNVPVIGVEQMYQALRANEIDSQLVIYPGEFHGISKPSYVKDRYERYLAWYDKYLKPGGEKGGGAVSSSGGQ